MMQSTNHHLKDAIREYEAWRKRHGHTGWSLWTERITRDLTGKLPDPLPEPEHGDAYEPPPAEAP